MVLFYNLYQSSPRESKLYINRFNNQVNRLYINMFAFKSNSAWTVITQTLTAEHFKSIDVSGAKVTPPHGLSNYPGVHPASRKHLCILG